MYDWELEQYLSERRYKITVDEYLHVCDACPQIRQVLYDKQLDIFKVWTDNRNCFSFKIYHKGEKRER